MLTGFNTNVRHRGMQFHVQTEDSGRARPHVVSHLYHGGVILASERREYAEQPGSAKLARDVRALMEDQHQAMLGRLKAGDFDELIDQRLGRRAKPAVAAGSVTATPTEPTLTAKPPTPGAPRKREERAFGAGIVSEKPLDEVILEYLVSKARNREPTPKPKRAGAARPAPRSRAEE